MISLLIATPGRAELLARSLSRLRTLTLPSQLVVVDDGSDEAEALAALVRDFEQETGVRSAYLRNHASNGNCVRPRNLGLRFCEQPRVVFACPECYFVSDVLAQLAATPAALTLTMAGTVWYGEDERDLARLDQLEMSGEGTANAPYVAIVDRHLLEEVGGWDENFTGWGGDDVDLMLRLEEVGVQREWCMEAQVLHQFHGDGGGVEEKMRHAQENSTYLYERPYMHGRAEHICSAACKSARGVIANVPGSRFSQ